MRRKSTTLSNARAVFSQYLALPSCHRRRLFHSRKMIHVPADNARYGFHIFNGQSYNMHCIFFIFYDDKYILIMHFGYFKMIDAMIVIY